MYMPSTITATDFVIQVKLSISGFYFGIAGRFHLIPTEDSLLHAFWKAGKATLEAEKLQIARWVEKKESQDVQSKAISEANILRSSAIITGASAEKNAPKKEIQT